MAYSVDDISKVESWTASGYDQDDIALDIDVTGCMINGTESEDCDEWKEGTINCKVELDVPPVCISSLKVRFYFNSVMSAGDNALLPYIDANSVSPINQVVMDYTIPGQWIEHICSAEFIAQLADIGGKCYVRLSASGGVAKSKIGEVQADVGWVTTEVAGVTRDNAGDPLGSIVVQAYKVESVDPLVIVGSPFDSDTSDTVTGAYSLDLYAGDWILIFFKAGSPDIMDISERITVV